MLQLGTVCSIGWWIHGNWQGEYKANIMLSEKIQIIHLNLFLRNSMTRKFLYYVFQSCKLIFWLQHCFYELHLYSFLYIGMLKYNIKNRCQNDISLKWQIFLYNQIQHIVESTGVFNNNHQTYFKNISRTDRQTDRHALLLKYLRYLKSTKEQLKGLPYVPY